VIIHAKRVSRNGSKVNADHHVESFSLRKTQMVLTIILVAVKMDSKSSGRMVQKSSSSTKLWFFWSSGDSILSNHGQQFDRKLSAPPMHAKPPDNQPRHRPVSQFGRKAKAFIIDQAKLPLAAHRDDIQPQLTSPTQPSLPHTKPSLTAKMSMFGFGARAPTSAEKISAVENELKVVAEMHTRYFTLHLSLLPRAWH
jgi:hypothetical protein